MASFYIFLPSNSNKENKIGNFKVKLPETIRLNGEWEMSLREFNYTRSWYNIGNAEDSHIAILNFPTAPSQTDLSIPFNNYDTPQQLMDAIHFAISQHFLRSYSNTDQRSKRASNQTKKPKASAKVKQNTTKTPKSISATNSTAAKVKQSTTKTPKSTSKEVKQPTTPKLPTKTTELTADQIVLLPSNEIKTNKLKKPNFKLFFDSTLGKSVLKNDQLMFYLVTSDKIGYMLGFENGKINYMSEYLDGSQYSVAPYPPDMNAGMYALMVHCDLVAPQLVGNTYANLLRMVPVVGIFNETITNIYNDEQYVPVLKKTFDSIEININDDTGKIVNFLYGRTFVTLHFRKRQRWVV